MVSKQEADSWVLIEVKVPALNSAQRRFLWALLKIGFTQQSGEITLSWQKIRQLLVAQTPATPRDFWNDFLLPLSKVTFKFQLAHSISVGDFFRGQEIDDHSGRVTVSLTPQVLRRLNTPANLILLGATIFDQFQM